MEPNEPDAHLSRIDTHWTAVFRAHGGATAEAEAAREALLGRYGGAVHRYLLASLRDPDAADDLAQEFALRFLRGDFRNADPGKGRFRDFVKRAIYHLMVDHHRGRAARPRALTVDVADPGDSAEEWACEHDRRFVESWRAALMARAWEALDAAEARTGQPFAAVLRLRVERPELRSADLAAILSGRLGRAVEAGWVRVNLHRARDLLVAALVAEVERSLEAPDPDRVEQELAELDLLEYCQPTLRRRGGAG